MFSVPTNLCVANAGPKNKTLIDDWKNIVELSTLIIFGRPVVAVVLGHAHDARNDGDGDSRNDTSHGPQPRVAAPGRRAAHGIDGQPADKAETGTADVVAEGLESKHAEAEQDASVEGVCAVEGQQERQEVEEEVAEQLDEECLARVEVRVADNDLGVVEGAVEDQTANTSRSKR